MNRLFAFIAGACAVASLTSGCGGGDSSSGSSDEPKAPTCPANATTNDEGGFCLTLPDGFGPTSSLSQGENRRSYGYGNASGYLYVEVTKTGDAAAFDRELALYNENDAVHRITSPKSCPAARCRSLSGGATA